MVLAENGDMGDDVLGRDVAGNDDETGEGSVAGARGGRLAQSLDDLLDTALKGTGLGSCYKSC